jgi:hypothetical protein
MCESVLPASLLHEVPPSPKEKEKEKMKNYEKMIIFL